MRWHVALTALWAAALAFPIQAQVTAPNGFGVPQAASDMPVRTANAAPTDPHDAHDAPVQPAPADDPSATQPVTARSPRPAWHEPAPPPTPALSVPRLADASAPVDLWPILRTWSPEEHIVDPDVLLERLSRFQTPASPTNNLGRASQPVWAHAAWEVDAASDGRWILILRHAALDDARVFVYEDGRRLTQARLGAAQPFADRPLPTNAHAFDLDLRPGTRVDIFVRLTARGAIVTPMTLEKRPALLRSEGRSQLMHGLILGFALGALGCSVVLALRKRDPLFIAHATWLVGSIGYIVCAGGLGQQHLWDSASDGLVGKLDVAFALLVAAAAASFLRRSLSTRRTAPILDGILRTLTIMAFTGMLMVPIATMSHQDLQQLAGVVGVLVLATGLAGAWPAHRRRGGAASFTLLGWGCQLVGAAAVIGIERGWLAANLLTMNVFEATFAAQIVAWTPVLGLHLHRKTAAARAAAPPRAEPAPAPDTDEVTGLPGRRGFAMALGRMLEEQRTRRAPDAVGVYIVGFDKLAPDDDPEPHRTRTALLVQAARRVESVLRAHDIVARLSGSDFAVAARVGDDSAAHVLGQKLVAAFRKPIGVDGALHKLRVTIGYAVSPDDADEPVRLLRRADLASFDARQSARGKLARYDPQAWPIEEETVQTQAVAQADPAGEDDPHFQDTAADPDVEQEIRDEVPARTAPAVGRAKDHHRDFEPTSA